jgi:pimeloyl-ACP methyl ester carboxylesterase
VRIAARGLTFDVHAGGPESGVPVLLLHGFPQDSREWDLVRPSLHAAGLRTYALDQRGYSPSARPTRVADYAMTEVVADAVAVLDALGLASAHVVGHDWGATVGWLLAYAHPDRVRSLTAVSVPHPKALAEALRGLDQTLRLWYFPMFRTRFAERLLLGRDAAALRGSLAPIGRDRADLYADAMTEPGRLTAALNWYRANKLSSGADVGTVRVPTTYVYSTRDGAVGPRSVRGTGIWVDGDYRLVVLPKISHWVPEQAPAALSDAIRARIIDDV